MDATDHEVIEVLYEQVDGIHVFTGCSENGRGLFVGHYDLRVAYDEVAFQLKNLLKVNLGSDGDVIPEKSFEELEAWIAQTRDPSQSEAESLAAKIPLNWAA